MGIWAVNKKLDSGERVNTSEEGAFCFMKCFVPVKLEGKSLRAVVA